MAKLNFITTASGSAIQAGRQLSLAVLANWAGTPKCRLYLDGESAPAFSNMVFISGSYRLSVSDIEAGMWVVEYSDDNGDKILCKIKVADGQADTCYPELEGLITFQVGVSDAKVTVTSSVGLWTGHTVLEAQALAERAVALHPNLLYQQMVYQDAFSTFAKAEWTNSQLESMNLTVKVDEVRMRRLDNSCTDVIATDLNLLNELEELEASFSKNNCSAVGANDGSITVSVQGGSGQYSFEWADGPITQNRINLAPGVLLSNYHRPCN